MWYIFVNSVYMGECPDLQKAVIEALSLAADEKRESSLPPEVVVVDEKDYVVYNFIDGVDGTIEEELGRLVGD